MTLEPLEARSKNFAEAFRLLTAGGNQDYIGEDVSQIEHALQCALLAEKQTGKIEHMMAALFHDIGHLLAYESAADDMNGLGRRWHEEVGADYLKNLGFPVTITELVRGHVAAKRYLVATNATYRARLSEASQQTLELQGGPMSPEDVQAFESDPLFREKLMVRVWDEKAKIKGLETPSLEYYHQRFLAAQL